MKEVDTLIYQRMINDSGLVSLVGAVSRIRYAFQALDAQTPQLVFHKISQAPGLLTGDFNRTLVMHYNFDVYANNYVDIHMRLLRLLDGFTFTIDPSSVEVGQVTCVFDAEGPENFDEGLEVSRKGATYRFFVVPKAQDPI